MRIITIIFYLFWFFQGIVAGQSIKISIPPTLTQSTKTVEGEVKMIYPIKCLFGKELSAEELSMVENPSNWYIRGEKKVYTVLEVQFPLKKNKCTLIGDWDIYDSLFLVFKGSPEMAVQTTDARGQTTKWGFGEGQAFDLKFNRLTKQENLYAFTHNFKVKVIERKFSIESSGLWMRSLSLDMTSEGTFGSDETVRNGTQSAVGLALKPSYFVSDLIYHSELNLSFQIETKMDDVEDQIFSIIDKKLKVGVEMEVPYTNYPVWKLHSITGYTRLAMPLTFSVDYLFGVEGDNGGNSFDRLDLKSRYELAISPYLILRGDWQLSKFINAPEGQDEIAYYYSYAMAQDLAVVKSNMGFLKLILGAEEMVQGKNFVFFKISRGKKAPAFVETTEKSIGFGTYF